MRVAIGPSSFAEQNDAPLRALEAAGLEVIPNPFKRRLTEDEIIAHLEGIDGLIAGLEPLNRRVLDGAKNLKAVARVGIGIANVDLEAAGEFGVKVSNTPDGPIGAVAEMTIGALLCLARRIPEMNSALHDQRWEKKIGTGLSGATALVIGYGRIGRRVAELLRAFGCRIVASDPFLKGEAADDGTPLVSLASGLADADVITIHASGERAILGEVELAGVKKGAILLNSARGGLVDEPALIAALESGRLGGAWLDAFAEEPYRGKLIGMDRVLMTPHAGTYTLQCRLSMESAAVENLLRDLGITSRNS